jgi:[ribosomal protein S18]-alanine N-acetyltransferase
VSPGALQIRLATPADAVAIAALSRTAIEHDLPWRWTPPRVRRSIADAATNVIVARYDDGSFAGFGVMKYGDDAAHLLLFAVRANARRRGVGSALLAWLERVALAAGVTRLQLEARERNAGALAFYRRHGWHVTASIAGMYLGLEDGVRLEKSIGAPPAAEDRSG